MFGIGIFEILVILVVAVIFLGPDKLPQAILDITKFFRAVKKTINDAKETFDKEVRMEEFKKQALDYKNSVLKDIDDIKKGTDSLTKELDFSDFSLESGKKEEDSSKKGEEKTPQKSKESLALENLNFQSELLDADIEAFNNERAEHDNDNTQATASTKRLKSKDSNPKESLKSSYKLKDSTPRTRAIKKDSKITKKDSKQTQSRTTKKSKNT